MNGSPALRPFLITELEGIDEIEDEWRALAEQRSNAFVTPEWLRAWWEHQGRDTSELLIAVLASSDGLVGVMPLVLDTSRRPRAIRFAGGGLGDRFHPVAREEREAEVAANAISLLRDAGLSRHLQIMEHVEPGRPWLAQLRESSTRRMAVREQHKTELPYVPLEGLDWESYLSSRSKKFRSNLRRAERVLVRDHGLNLTVATEDSLSGDLDHFFRLHRMRWGAQTSLGAPGAEAVLRAFAAAAQQRGWLRLHLLEADDSPVAALLGWRVGESYNFYNSGFDPAWSKQSVGTVMTGVAIRSAIEEEAREFDFLLGTEAYKLKFTGEARLSENVILAPAMSPLSFMVAVEGSVRRVGRRLADVPGLGGASRALRRLLPTSRSS